MFYSITFVKVFLVLSVQVIFSSAFYRHFTDIKTERPHERKHLATVGRTKSLLTGRNSHSTRLRDGLLGGEGRKMDC